MRGYYAVLLIVGVGIAAAAAATTTLAIIPAQSAEPEHDRLHVTQYLAFKGIPPNDYLLLLDTTPDAIAGGHLAIKADCDANGIGAVNVLLGIAPDMNAVSLGSENMVSDLSKLGKMCLYHVDLPPEHDMMITDIAIGNPTSKTVKLGATSSVTIYANSFGDGVEHEEHMESGSEAETDESDHS